MRRLLLVIALLSFSGAVRAAAQKDFLREPRRPRLAQGADTNNAATYFAYGVRRLQKDPDRAAAAFYWASRLAPGWGAPLYGRYAALLLGMPPDWLTDYFTAGPGDKPRHGVVELDSLAYQALLDDPFLERRFLGVVLNTWLDRQTHERGTLRSLGYYDRRFTAWAAYFRGNYKKAASVYAEVVGHHPDDPELRLWQALSLYSLGQHDSARVALEARLRMKRRADSTETWAGWTSSAFAEYSIGVLYGLDHKVDSAEAAYHLALVEDLAFYPAYHRLGVLHLAAHDTAAALTDYSEAVTLAPGNPAYLYDLGMLLVEAGQPDSGARVLQRATVADPFFALPHYTLGVLYQRAGFRAEAIDHLRTFLQLAPQTLENAITSAQAHLRTLREGA